MDRKALCMTGYTVAGVRLKNTAIEDNQKLSPREFGLKMLMNKIYLNSKRMHGQAMVKPIRRSVDNYNGRN